jgi:hypothetical protein
MLTVLAVRGIRLQRLSVNRPAPWNRKPFFFSLEKGLRKNATGDREITSVIWISVSIAQYASAHLCKVSGSIGLREGFPCQRAWQWYCVRKNTSADNKIARRMQLEQKQFAGLKGFEISSRRRPKIHLRPVLADRKA